MPSSRQRALSRDIILSSALDLVDEEGLSALSLRSLGKRLGVSQAAFYRHFPDKAALLEGIAEQVWRLTFEAFLGRVDAGALGTASAPTHEAPEPTEGTPTSPLLTYMRTYAHCLASTLRSHPGAVMLLLTHPMSTPEQLSLLAAEVVPPVGGSPEQPVDLSAASAALAPEDAQALRPLIEDLLDGRYDFNAQFERGLEAILRGWA